MRDKATVAYFDEHTPEYGDYRLAYALERIKGISGAETSLCDIGCGVGNILEMMKKETSLKELCGIDVSENCLAQTRGRVGAAETYCGSVVDTAFVEGIGKRFDIVMLSAVLHHLIGRTRAESKMLARTAVKNSLKLLKDGGYLIVLEPTFSPAFSMWLVFWVKKLVTSVTTRRIGIFDRWNNIGAPVVSYFTVDELTAVLASGGDCRIDAVHVEECKVNLLLRLAMITKRVDTTVVVRKAGVRG